MKALISRDMSKVTGNKEYAREEIEQKAWLGLIRTFLGYEVT